MSNYTSTGSYPYFFAEFLRILENRLCELCYQKPISIIRTFDEIAAMAIRMQLYPIPPEYAERRFSIARRRLFFQIARAVEHKKPEKRMSIARFSQLIDSKAVDAGILLRKVSDSKKH